MISGTPGVRASRFRGQGLSRSHYHKPYGSQQTRLQQWKCTLIKPVVGECVSLRRTGLGIPDQPVRREVRDLDLEMVRAWLHSGRHINLEWRLPRNLLQRLSIYCNFGDFFDLTEIEQQIRA